MWASARRASRAVAKSPANPYLVPTRPATVPTKSPAFGIASPSVLKAFASGRLFGVAHGTGPAAVLGLPGWARTHRDFSVAFHGLDAVALDLPGFGASPPPSEPWGAAVYAAAVAPVLEEMAQPAVVVGHSFGGRVAVQLAVLRPERVGGLVLTGVPLLRRGAGPRRPPLVYRVGRALHRRGLVGEPAMDGLRRRFGSADYRAAEGVMRQVLVRVVNETYEEELAAISCPAELVWGDDDGEVPLEVAERALSLLSDAKLTVVPGAGHLTPLTAPGELRAAVERHLRSRL